MFVVMEEQVVIAERATELLARADRTEALVRDARMRAADLDHATLAKAFRGELVPQDPRDEPAAALLERIRDRAPATRGARRTSGRSDEAMLDG